MTQTEVLEFLQSHPGWHGAQEIAQAINCSHASVVACIGRLRKSGEVVARYLGKGRGTPVQYQVA